MIIIISDSWFIRLSSLALLYGYRNTSTLVNVVDHPNESGWSRASELHGKDHRRGILKFHGHRREGRREPIQVRARKVMAQAVARCLARDSCLLVWKVTYEETDHPPHIFILLLLDHLPMSFSFLYIVPTASLTSSTRQLEGATPAWTWRADRNLGAGLASWKIMPMRIRDVFLAKMRDNGISR